jgi:hypothetical protein
LIKLVPTYKNNVNKKLDQRINLVKYDWQLFLFNYLQRFEEIAISIISA